MRGHKKSPRLWLMERSYLSHQTTFASEAPATEDIIVPSMRVLRIYIISKNVNFCPTINLVGGKSDAKLLHFFDITKFLNSKGVFYESLLSNVR